MPPTPSAETSLRDAPWWLAVWPAAIIYPALLLMIFVYRHGYNVMVRKEGGIEVVTVVALLVGVGFGVALLSNKSYRAALPARWLVVWFALVTLASFVIAGEEISWGQHLGFWGHEDVPDWLAEVNDQQETNLHNIGNVMDMGVTNIFVLTTFIGFVAIPLIRRWLGEPEPTPDLAAYWFWPTSVGLVAALGVLVIPVPKQIVDTLTGDHPQVMRHSEIHECYIALLLMTYLASAWFRLRAAQAAAPCMDPARA